MYPRRGRRGDSDLEVREACVGAVKPDREIFDHVLRDLGVPPHRIAFFDDTPVNVEAAQQAGLVAYAVIGIADLTTQLRHLGIAEHLIDEHR